MKEISLEETSFIRGTLIQSFSKTAESLILNETSKN